MDAVSLPGPLRPGRPRRRPILPRGLGVFCEGFSLHAGVFVSAMDGDALDDWLACYIAKRVRRAVPAAPGALKEDVPSPIRANLRQFPR